MEINKYVDWSFEAGKAAEAPGKRLLCDEFLALMESVVQTPTMEIITDQGRVNAFRSPSVARGAKKEAALAAEAQL